MSQGFTSVLGRCWLGDRRRQTRSRSEDSKVSDRAHYRHSLDGATTCCWPLPNSSCAARVRCQVFVRHKTTTTVTQSI